MSDELSQMLKILDSLLNKNKCEEKRKIIIVLYDDIKKVLSNDDYATDTILNNIKNYLNYLTEMYNDEEIYDLINLYDPVYYYYIRENKKKHIEKLRQKK